MILENKKQKQKIADRTIVFFDAVLAIAITMIALEIHIPETGPISSEEFRLMFEQGVTFLISFYALGSLWYFHMQFFSSGKFEISNANVVLHLVLMALVCLYPVATRLVLVSNQLESKLIYISIFTLVQLFNMAIVWQTHSDANEKEESQRKLMDDLLDGKDSKAAQQYMQYKKFMEAGVGQETIPDYASMISNHLREVRQSKRFVYLSSIINVAAVYLAVFILMENVALSLVPIAVAFVILICLRYRMFAEFRNSDSHN